MIGINKRKPNKSVKNQDLWIQMDNLIKNQTTKIQFEWVKGHSGHELNEKADLIAQNEAEKALLN